MNRLSIVLFILLNLGRYDSFIMNCKEAIKFLTDVKCVKNKAIAEGSQGKVFLVTDNLAENDNRRILKVQELKSLKSAIGEIHKKCLLSKLKHPNIIQIYKIFKANGYFFELMEFGINGTLTDFIYKNPEYFGNRNKVLKMFVDIVGAVEYTHREGWIHADLKTDNIVLGIGNEVKLIDFDFSIQIGSTNSRRGTFLYMKPELLVEDTHTFLFDAQVDVYALGVILYQLAFKNQFPFYLDSYLDLDSNSVLDSDLDSYSDSNEELFNLIRKGEFTFPINSDLEICYLIHGCLRGDRKERFSMVKLLEIAKQAMENKSPENLKEIILVSAKEILDEKIFGKVVKKYKNVDELIREDEKAIKIIKKKGKANRFIFGSMLVFLLLSTVLGVAGSCTFYKREARIEDTFFG